jgi:hypothetical protein
MYNAHRGMVQPPSNNNRLSELFDQIRREFDAHSQERAGEHDQNSEFDGLSLLLRSKLGACTLPLLCRWQRSALKDPITVDQPAQFR